MRFFLIFFGFILPACATVTERQLETTSLPDPAWLGCCWQAQEHIAVDNGSRTTSLMAVSSLQQDRLTMVLLDTLGRRVLTLTQQGQAVVIDPGEAARQLPVKLFLLGFYLRYMPDGGWQKLNEYQVNQSAADYSELLGKSGVMVTLQRHPKGHLVLQYPNAGLQVRVTDVKRELIR